MSDYERGWNAAIEAAAKVVDEHSSTYATSSPRFACMVAADIVRALAKPESQPTCARDCPLCSGEACGKCGAGLWRMPAVDGMTCNHDSAERHEEPATAKPLDLGVKERLVGE